MLQEKKMISSNTNHANSMKLCFLKCCWMTSHRNWYYIKHLWKGNIIFKNKLCEFCTKAIYIVDLFATKKSWERNKNIYLGNGRTKILKFPTFGKNLNVYIGILYWAFSYVAIKSIAQPVSFWSEMDSSCFCI